MNTPLNETTPQGELVIKTLAMPNNTNASGDIFGGWLVAQMDLGGSVLAFECAQGRVVTVAIKEMTFMKAVKIGDTVSCYAGLARKGRTSMDINLEVWAHSRSTFKNQKVAQGCFVFVAVNEAGKPQAIQWS